MTGLYLHSAALGIGTTSLALLLGWCAAIVYLGANNRLRPVLLAAAASALLMPPFLVANTWLEWSQGWIVAAPGATAFEWKGIALVSILLASMFWPIPCALLASHWKRLPAAQLEVCPDLKGTSLWRYLLFPDARPRIIVSCLIVLALALSDFSLATLFQVRVFTEEFWIRFNTQLDTTGALIATWPLALLVAIPWWMRRRSLWTVPTPTAGPISEAAQWRRALSNTYVPACFIVVITFLFSVGAPLGRLLSESQTWRDLPAAWSAGSGALINSFIAAAGSATIVILLGALLAGAGGRKRRAPLWSWAFFILPGVLLGIGWIWILTHGPITSLQAGFSIVILALAVRHLPLGWAVLSHALASNNSAQHDVARLAGATHWQTARHVEWPQTRITLCAAWYVIYLLCLWDVESIILIIPPGGETVALRIFNLLHYGHAGHVHSLCFALLLIGMAPALIGLELICLWRLYQKFTNTAMTGSLNAARASTAVVAGIVLSTLAGCTDAGASRGTDTRAPLDSSLFKEAHVIGSRGVAPGQFNKPRSLTCDGDGNLYVADLTGRIQKFDSKGEFLLQWHVEVSELGKPKGMGIDPAGNVLVVEPHYMRVNHYSPEGVHLAVWGQRGIAPGEFILPRAIAVNSRGEYFLSEYTLVDRVQRFGPFLPNASEGPKYLGGWGEAGHAPGEFGRAEGLCVGPDDAVYVADSCNHRIQVFTADGTLLHVWGGPGTGPGQFSYPYDVHVDSTGHVFVCEFGNSRISVLDAEGRLIETIGEAGSLPGQFANPWSMALDPQGNLYVADSQNHRVQKLVRRRALRGGTG